MDTFCAAMIAESWKRPSDDVGRDNLVENIGNILHRASDVAMPRNGGARGGRKQAYWWSDDIA